MYHHQLKPRRGFVIKDL